MLSDGASHLYVPIEMCDRAFSMPFAGPTFDRQGIGMLCYLDFPKYLTCATVGFQDTQWGARCL